MIVDIYNALIIIKKKILRINTLFFKTFFLFYWLFYTLHLLYISKWQIVNKQYMYSCNHGSKIFHPVYILDNFKSSLNNLKIVVMKTYAKVNLCTGTLLCWCPPLSIFYFRPPAVALLTLPGARRRCKAPHALTRVNRMLIYYWKCGHLLFMFL